MQGNNANPHKKCQIHNVRFYNLPPRGINSITYNVKSYLLALAREDASIEIWNMQHAPYLQQTFVGSDAVSVEALGWANDRLFSTGLTGELIEWNLQTLDVHQKLLLTGNAAWCLDVNKQNTQIVIGTDNGYINVYDVSNENEINYVKLFDKQEGKVLCCKFDHSGEFVVSGSADAIRIWKLETGHAVYKLSVGRLEKRKETLVWSLAVLSDFTIIAGDSRGYITVWDGKMGASIDTLAASARDILAIAVSEDEKTFACAGIDPKIKIYVLSEIKKADKIQYSWVKNIQRFTHQHDVKVLQFIDSRIASGGVDGYLALSNPTKEKRASSSKCKFGPFLQKPCSMVASERRVLLLKYPNYIELWQLGVPSQNIQIVENAQEKKSFLGLEKGLYKLLEMRAKDDLAVICAAISPDGQYVVYSTKESIRLFHVTYEDNKIENLTRIKLLPEQFSPSYKCLFSADSKTFYLVKKNHTIDIFQISNGETAEIDFRDHIDVNKSTKGPIAHVAISGCGKYLVCADHCCNITVWKRNKNSWSLHMNLPKYPLSPTTLAIHPNEPKLVVAFSDGKLFEYHLKEMRFLCSTMETYLNNQHIHAIKNIVLDPRNENIFILHNDTNIFVLQKEHQKPKVNESPNVKRSKLVDEEPEDEENIIKLVCKRRSPDCEHLVDLCWMGESELVAVGVNPVTLIEQLPPTLKEKQFGVS